MASDSEWTNIHAKDSILHQAAYIGNLEKVKWFLRESHQRKMINSTNWLGCTPLRLAATAGHVHCVTFLIYHGADIDLADVKAQTPLFVAVKNKHLNCVRALLELGANPNGNIQSLCTPLYIAAMDGFLQGVKELIKHTADIDRSQLALGSFNSTPLYISIAYHHLDCFKELLSSGADPDFVHKAMVDKRHSPSCQSLYHAVIRHNVEVDYAELLYDYGACLYYRDEKGKLPSEYDHDNECKHYIKTLYESSRSLLSSCRLAIRRSLGRENLPKLEALPLPKKLLQYLKHDPAWQRGVSHQDFVETCHPLFSLDSLGVYHKT